MKTNSERSGEIRAAIKTALIEMNACVPATIIEITGDTVTVQPYIRKPRMLEDGSWSHEKTEVIEQVPVAMPNCGEFSFNIPLSVGCEGVLWFADYDIDNWATGAGDIPNTARVHDQNDAIFQPAFNGGNIGGDCMELSSSSVTVRICPDGFDVIKDGESMIDSINGGFNDLNQQLIACRCGSAFSSLPLDGWNS